MNDATAQALEDATPVEMPEGGADDDLSAAYDRLTADGVEDEHDEPAEQGEAAQDEVSEAVEEEPQTPEKETPEAPTDIPAALRQHWKDMPEAARQAVMQSHRDLTSKLGQQGRMLQGIAPIRDALVDMAKEHPQLAQMKPDEVVSEMRALASVSAAFHADPVKAVMGLIEQHKLADAVGAALQGRAPEASAHVAQLNNEIRSLKAQIAKMGDPEAIRENFNQWTAEKTAADLVSEFAAQAGETWGAVEPHLPNVIPLARQKLGESASAKDVLTEAFNMATALFAPPAEPQPSKKDMAADEARAKAAMRAKSVNVKSSDGPRREMSEDEILSRKYDELMAKG